MTDVLLALILVALAILLSRVQRLGLESELVVSVVRAIVQLGALTAVINVVFNQLGLAGVFLIVMLVAAAHTSGRRLTGIKGARVLAAMTIGLAAFVAMSILFGTRVFPVEPQYLIPIGGMLIGNSMTAVSLAGARLRDEITDKTLEIESRLALGVPAPRCFAPVCAARRGSCIDSDNRLDQERRTHLPSGSLRRNDARGSEPHGGCPSPTRGALHAPRGRFDRRHVDHSARRTRLHGSG